MEIYLATDHAGFELKEVLKSYIREIGFEVKDLGAHAFDEDDDYPDYISLVAKKVSEHPTEVRAIILGGSGQGEAIVANKFPNVRSVVFYGGTSDIITLSREHNDANVLSLGARFLTEEQAKEAVKLWLETPFGAEERHVRRLDKLSRIEEKNFKNL